MTSDDTAEWINMADTVTDDLQLDDVFAPEAPKAETPPETETAGQPRDENGRFAPKQEAQPEPKAETPDAQPEAEATPRHVPLKELQTERQKRQEQERLRAEAEGRAAAYERQLQLLTQQHQPAPPQQQEPDWYAEPDKAALTLQQQVQRQLVETKVSMSREFARSQFKDYDEHEQLFTQAANANPHLWQQLYAHPMPAQFAYQQAKRLKAMQDIGDDPDAYRNKLKEEATAAVLADLKAGKIKLDGKPVPQQRFPGTLADQTSAGTTQTPHLSDDAMMNGIFAR